MRKASLDSTRTQLDYKKIPVHHRPSQFNKFLELCKSSKLNWKKQIKELDRDVDILKKSIKECSNQIKQLRQINGNYSKETLKNIKQIILPNQTKVIGYHQFKCKLSTAPYVKQLLNNYLMLQEESKLIFKCLQQISNYVKYHENILLGYQNEKRKKQIANNLEINILKTEISKLESEIRLYQQNCQHSRTQIEQKRRVVDQIKGDLIRDDKLQVQLIQQNNQIKRNLESKKQYRAKLDEHKFENLIFLTKSTATQLQNYSRQLNIQYSKISTKNQILQIELNELLQQEQNIVNSRKNNTIHHD